MPSIILQQETFTKVQTNKSYALAVVVFDFVKGQNCWLFPQAFSLRYIRQTIFSWVFHLKSQSSAGCCVCLGVYHFCL